jgi:tricorn protease
VKTPLRKILLFGFAAIIAGARAHAQGTVIASDNFNRPNESPFAVNGNWGRTIAGNYDGNVDVYTVPAAGGIPKRLTWHPAPDMVLGWSPDGKKILFSSPRQSHANLPEIFTLDPNGVFPEKVPLPWGWEAAYSPDGTRLAYVPMRRAFTTWKQYRGGDTTPIWLAALATSKIEKLPRDNSNDYNPMWIGNKVYFLSDRSGPITLFAYDNATKKVAPLIQNTGLDIKSASAGPDAIVYEQFGALNLFDLKSGKTKKLNITVTGDIASVRPKFEKIQRAELLIHNRVGSG